MKQVARRIDEAHRFLRTQHHRQSPPVVAWIRQVLFHVPPLQCLRVQEANRGDMLYHRPHGEFALLQQIRVITAQVIWTEAIEPFSAVLLKLPDDSQIRSDRAFRIVASHEFLAHTLLKSVHRELLSLWTKLTAFAAYVPYASASAARAASSKSASVFQSAVPFKLTHNAHAADVRRLLNPRNADKRSRWLTALVCKRWLRRS